MFHSPPLCNVDGLDDPRDLVDERDRAGDVIESLHVADLLPRHRHVLQQLEDGVWHVLEGSGHSRQQRIGWKVCALYMYLRALDTAGSRG